MSDEWMVSYSKDSEELGIPANADSVSVHREDDGRWRITWSVPTGKPVETPPREREEG